MQYLALVYGNAQIWGSLGEDFATLVGEVDAFNAALRASGEMVDVQGLQGPVEHVRAGQAVLTDGPYLEAKEHVGSFFVLDVPSVERAREIVASYPGLQHFDGGGLELWPLMRTKA